MLQQKLASFSGDLTRSVSMFWRIHPGLSLLNLVLFIFQGILPVGYLWALKKFIDVILKEGGFNWSTCGVWLGAFAGLQLLTLVIGQVSGYFQQKQQQVIGDDLSMRVLGKAIRLDVDVYENPSFNDALLMVQQQTLYKPVQIIGTLQQLLQQIITVASLSVFLFSLHWSVPFLLVLLSLPLAGSKLLHGYQQFVLDKTILPLQRKSNELYRYLTSDGYAKEVRVFGYGTYFIKKFTSLRQFITNKKNELEYRFLRKDLAIQFFEILVISLFYVILLGRATAGAISIGGLVIYFQVLQRVQGGINSVFRSCISVFQQQLYLREVQEYLAMETEPETAAAQLSGGEGLEINQVSFSYPRTGRLVLDNVSLRAKPGQLIAIVGENGSGKSTLMKLICGLYKAAHGTVTIMGNNAATLSTESRSKLVTAVFQDFGKYYLTLAENIAIGDQEPEEAQLKRALYLAEGSGLLAAAPSGFQSQLGRTYKNGWQLSGGQWQKVAIARAVYRNTPLLVLDEPTSAVDPSAEYEIFQQLRRMLGTERMMVLITHRLYNLRIADCIYVMENGKLVEQGNFEELVQARGHFYALYQKQQA